MPFPLHRCHAKNKEGEAESRARLEIVEFVERKKSDAPEFLKKIGDELVFREVLSHHQFFNVIISRSQSLHY